MTGQSAVGTEAEGAVQRPDTRLTAGRQGTGGGRQVVVVVVVVMVDGGGGGGAFRPLASLIFKEASHSGDFSPRTQDILP